MPRIYQMKSSYYRTIIEQSKLQVYDFVKNDRHLFGICGKKFIKSETIRTKFMIITKQVIELKKAQK